MIWTVALSVKRQPKFYLIVQIQNKTISTFVDESEVPTDLYKRRYHVHKVTGWERRAEPGDIIDFKPIEQEHIWTPYERTAFLIVTVYGATLEQMQQGMVEPLWDLDSYMEYNPLSFDEMDAEIRAKEEEWLQSGRKTKKKWDDFSLDEKQKNYESYLEVQVSACSYPSKHLKKRRMNIRLEKLEEYGVNTSLMLDTKELYDPKPRPFHFTECFDKMKNRKLDTSDNLKRIAKRDVLLGY